MKTKLTLGKLIKDYSNVLNNSIIEKLKNLQKKQSSFNKMAEKLGFILFSEETDYMLDSGVDVKDRNRGINPMSKEYQQEVDRKRKALGVSPLNEAGLSKDNSSTEFCRDVIRNTKNYSEKVERNLYRKKDIVYVDMDGVLVDFQSGIDALTDDIRQQYKNRLDEVPGIFSKMKPYTGAIDGFKWLSEYFEVYILSTAPWENSSAWSDKADWVKKYLGKEAYKKLILSHHKNLLKGQYIIDDRTARGVDGFEGKHIHFNTKDFKDWQDVIKYLKY